MNEQHEFVILFFYSNKCVHCDEMESKLKDNFIDIKIVKIDVDKDKEAALKYSVEYVPTILVFRKEVIISHIVGYQDCIGYLKDIFLQVK